MRGNDNQSNDNQGNDNQNNHAPEQQVQLSRDSFLASLVIMKQQGVPIHSLIDIGCADGTFSLECLKFINPKLALFNIEAQAIYEPSLRKIQNQVGGYYEICAVSANDSIVQLSSSPHAYWSKINAGHQDSNDQAVSDQVVAECVDCRKIDSLLEEVDLPAPYVIKMDIEGGEFNALQGAVKTLDNTAALILETDIYYAPHSAGNFLDIYNFLAARNFSLFDLTNFGYRQTDRALFQVYSVFLNKEFEFRHKQGLIEGAEALESLTESMVRRREALIQYNETILNQLAPPNAS